MPASGISTTRIAAAATDSNSTRVCTTKILWFLYNFSSNTTTVIQLQLLLLLLR